MRVKELVGFEKEGRALIDGESTIKRIQCEWEEFVGLERRRR